MPRRRFPSDDARVKTRPHVRIHLTARSHRRTAEVFADPELRGMLVGLWALAAEAYAGRNGNVVHLDRTAVMWITGRTQVTPASRALHALCARMSYPVRTHGALIVVEVRNFQQKQGYGSADGVAPPRTPDPSEVLGPKTKDRGIQAAEPLDPERLVNLLSKEPGDAQAKLAWLKTELPMIELLADEDHPGDPERRMRAVRSRVLRHYRQHRKNPQKVNGNAPPAPGSRAERRARAQDLYSVQRLLPEPTEEALARWEADGAPLVRGWWLPEPERVRLRMASA